MTRFEQDFYQILNDPKNSEAWHVLQTECNLEMPKKLQHATLKCQSNIETNI